MKTTQKIVEEQVQRWHLLKKEPPPGKATLPVITLSREAGSGGRLVAQAAAEHLKMGLFHQEVLHEMAKSSHISKELLQTLDERALNVLEDYITSLVHQQHLWPDQYLRHLLRVIGTIGRHGMAVVVGRGANFILPPEGRFRVRIVAPLDFRIKQVAKEYELDMEEAETRVMRTDSNRKAFVRKYFHADIADPANYDMILNSATMGIEGAVKTLCAAVKP